MQNLDDGIYIIQFLTTVYDEDEYVDLMGYSFLIKDGKLEEISPEAHELMEKYPDQKLTVNDIIRFFSNSSYYSFRKVA